MNYFDFQEKLAPFTVFSLNDARKAFSNFHRQRLSEWTKKGYIKKVIRGYYLFTNRVIDETILFIAANTIYDPSYISLETALSHYGLIPEGVYTVTSVSSRKTILFGSDSARFEYRQIQKSLFWGYRLEKSTSGQSFTIAEPEKALLDFVYLHSNVRTVDDFRGLRLNEDSFRKVISIKKLRAYAKQFGKASVSNRLENLLQSVII